MACAYGVEPLVEKLVAAGADVNACNSFGYSSLLEACHRCICVLNPLYLWYICVLNPIYLWCICVLKPLYRGYIVVARTLLASPAPGVNLAFIPDEELAQESPFFSAPYQSALAEASRCGFFKVVQTLLDAGRCHMPICHCHRIGVFSVYMQSNYVYYCDTCYTSGRRST
jgi:hypothetical protein